MAGKANGQYLRAKAYEVIKHKIVHCELEPGSPVSEKDLIAEIGVSRTPIRDALNKLEHENLVKIYPKRGIFITDISIKDIIDIYTMRIVVEPFAARSAAPLIDVKALEPYDEIWSNADYNYAPDEHIRLDREFHRLIAESADNKYLTQILFQLYDQVNRIRFLSLRRVKHRREETRQEHVAIIRALMDRDQDQAELAMRAHLTRAKDTALQVFL